MVNVDKQLDMLFSQSQWKKARQIIMKELKKEPEDHWLLTRLGTTYYEEKQYRKALELSKEAIKLAPRCPLVLWDYAGALDMVGDSGHAIKVWKKLLRLGVDKVANEECGEGLRWARSLLNDCRYRIGLAYYKINRLAISTEYIQDHIKNRQKGIPSIYKLSMVRRKLVAINDKRRGDL